MLTRSLYSLAACAWFALKGGVFFKRVVAIYSKTTLQHYRLLDQAQSLGGVDVRELKDVTTVN